MSRYEALPHAEVDDDDDEAASDSGSEHNRDGQPHARESSSIQTHHGLKDAPEATSPARSLKKAQDANLAGSQHLKAAKGTDASSLKETLSAVSPGKRGSILSSVINQLRKGGSCENMYDLVEDDDYAVVERPEEQQQQQQQQQQSRTLNDSVGEPASKEPQQQHDNDSKDKANAVAGSTSLMSSPDIIGASDVTSGDDGDDQKHKGPRRSGTPMAKLPKSHPLAITIPAPGAEQHAATTSPQTAYQSSTCSGVPQTPISAVPQTPISAHSTVDIASPRPDLQSLQGAYVSNIARLERSVEHLSESSDIESEIRKMKEEQERKGNASLNGSVSGKGSMVEVAESGLSNVATSEEKDNIAVSKRSSPSSSPVPLRQRSTSASLSAKSRLPKTLDEVPEPEAEQDPDDSVLLGAGLHGYDNTDRAASFTRTALPPPITPPPPPTLLPGPYIDVQAATPTSARSLDPGYDHSYGHSHGPSTDSTATVLPMHDPYAYAPPEQTYYQPQSHVPHGIPANEMFFPSYPPRPSSAASGDTYQQAKTAFQDFDGVHVASHPRPSTSIGSVSLRQPSLEQQRPSTSGDAAPGPSRTAPRPAGPQGNSNNLVFYPAPVPAMLNLPGKLSKNRPDLEREKRRTQILMDSAAAAEEHSEPGNNESGPTRAKRRSRFAKLPGALRAAAFFDGLAPGADNTVIAPKNGSAVQTMDALLDAAAKAPADAFTGGVGGGVSDVEGVKRKKRVHLVDHAKQPGEGEREGDGSGDEEGGERADDRLMGFRRQSTYDADKQQIAPDDEEDSGEDSGQLESDDDDFHGAPTTLLAELEMRKKAQKKRTKGKEVRARTGNNNMRSTLLQLDTIAQIQHEARRKKKHITLAWEDPAAAAAAEKEGSSDDDNVPLGVLMQQRATKDGRPPEGFRKAVEEFKPTGLMEKLELEENEPLSKRRARLTGQSQLDLAKRRGSLVPQPPPAPVEQVEEESSDEHEGETLAQRAARLRREETETLAQRMARLKKEKELKAQGVDDMTDFGFELLNLFDEAAEQSKVEETPSGHASNASQGEDQKKHRRASRYHGSKGGSGSIYNSTSHLTAPVPGQALFVSGSEDGGETLAQRRSRLRQSSQGNLDVGVSQEPTPGDETNAEAGTTNANQQMTEHKAKASLADLLATHPQRHSTALPQRFSRSTANANQTTKPNPYMNAAQDVAAARGTPLYASAQNNNRRNPGTRPGTLLGDWTKAQSAVDLSALNAAANTAPKQEPWQNPNPFARQSSLSSNQQQPPQWQGSQQQMGGGQAYGGPPQGLPQQQRASTMVGAQNTSYSQPQAATSRLTFQGMPLYAHQSPQTQPSATPNPAAPQQNFRMSYIPGRTSTMQYASTPPVNQNQMNPNPPQTAVANPAQDLTAGFDFGYQHGYRAGLEQARMAMLGMGGNAGQSEAGVDRWRQSVAY